jgi:hypothetical protein
MMFEHNMGLAKPLLMRPIQCSPLVDQVHHRLTLIINDVAICHTSDCYMDTGASSSSDAREDWSFLGS